MKEERICTHCGEVLSDVTYHAKYKKLSRKIQKIEEEIYSE